MDRNSLALVRWRAGDPTAITNTQTHAHTRAYRHTHRHPQNHGNMTFAARAL